MVKNLLMSQDDEGHAATGVPQEEVSMVSLAFVTLSGTSLRYNTRQKPGGNLCLDDDLRSRTRCCTNGVSTELRETLNEDVLDASCVELRSPDASSSSGESLSIAASLLFRDCAARTLRAICAGDRAAGRGVNGHLVGGHEVDGLQDVDFTTSRPVGALGPETGPDLRSSHIS